MIVCSCNVLSDRQIREVVSQRAPRMTSQVYGCLGCSAQCGRCARTIRKIMDQALKTCDGNCACCPNKAHKAAADDAAQLDHSHSHRHPHSQQEHAHRRSAPAPIHARHDAAPLVHHEHP